MQTCPSCGEENPDRFRLCGYCGTVLVAAQPPPQEEVRKTVTIVFCDLKDSTALGDRLARGENVNEFLTASTNLLRERVIADLAPSTATATSAPPVAVRPVRPATAAVRSAAGCPGST